MNEQASLRVLNSSSDNLKSAIHNKNWAQIVAIVLTFVFGATVAEAQQTGKIFRIGFLDSSTASGIAVLLDAFQQELSKLGGPPGWLLSAAIASSTTAVMGYAAARWFERGERVTRESLQSILRGLTQYLLEALRGLGQRRPGRDSLRQRVSEALEQSPMAEDLGEAGRTADAN